MPDNGETPPGLHFAGVNTRLLLRYLREVEGADAVQQVLSESGETRTEDELLDNATWSSYDQFRRLLETTARCCGTAALERASSAGMTDGSQAEMTAMLQSLGSPTALLEMIAEAGGAGLAPALKFDANEVGPTEWLLREHFADGFEPFPEYCSWATGLYTNIPSLFGVRTEVIKEACACEGAPACVYRLSWFPDDENGAADNFEARIAVLTARLEGLQQMVGELVSDDDLERVLTQIVVSAARSMSAPIFVLALEAMPSADKLVYAVGTPDDAAERLAAELLAGARDDDESHLIVDVKSNRRRYGRLAAVNPMGRFFPQERVVFEAYARLAAAALDSAAAVEEARRQAQSARALLDLSNSLAEIATPEEMATHITRAVTAVVGCDRSAVILFEPKAAIGRVAATWGFSPEHEEFLRAFEVPVGQMESTDASVIVWDRDRAAGRHTLPGLMDTLGSLAIATIAIVVDGDPVGLVVADVTERPERLCGDNDVTDRLRGLASQATIAIRNARLLESIRHQALHDSLTGLPNRTLILDRVEQMLARARRSDVPCAALFIDLDGFKQVNDTLGHETGDRLLRAVATRLSATLRETDTIARLGGDEFVVLVEGGAPTGSPEFVAERLLEVLREPFEIDNAPRGTLRITASIGIAFGVHVDATDLLRDADIALYEAKTAGRDRYVTFQRAMQDAVQDRLTLELDLRAASERSEFFLVYQPIFDLENGRALGVEALLRWNHPTRGEVQPDSFIPLLEETKQIVEVGRWVLNEACRQAAVWQLPDRNMYVSVNVSARQLDDEHLVADLQHALAASGLSPSSLVIEVTETAIMRDATLTASQLRTVKALGIDIAIDDFGTGYSSLAYLRQFPVDILKIDRSFITPLADSAESKALLHTLVQLGKQLGLKTLAEGIEQHEQFCQLQAEDCDSGQGFMFARPLAAGDVLDFLAALPHPQLAANKPI